MSAVTRVRALSVPMVFALFLSCRTATTFPEGTYVHPESQDPRAVSRYAGLEIDFIDGHYEIRRDEELRVSGRYEVSGDQITLIDEEGIWACTSTETPAAVYRWSIEEGAVHLTAESTDRCNRRRNRFSEVRLRQGRTPAFAPVVDVPDELAAAWRHLWLESGENAWIDRTFTPDAVVEDGSRRMTGIEEIRSWLGGQDSGGETPLPFDFRRSGADWIESGRYRVTFAATSASSRIIVGRYRIRWVLGPRGEWMVKEWILR